MDAMEALNNHQNGVVEEVAPPRSVDEAELYFLITHALSGGPLAHIGELLANEAAFQGLFPTRVDFNGDRHPVPFQSLQTRYAHLPPDALRHALRDLLNYRRAELPGISGRNLSSVLDPAVIPGRANLLQQTLLPSSTTRAPQWTTLPPHSVITHNGNTLRSPRFVLHRESSVLSAGTFLPPPAYSQLLQHHLTIRGHTLVAYCIIFDKKGCHIITGSDDRLVKIWAVATGLLRCSCRGHDAEISDLSVNCDNSMVASSSVDGDVRVWRLHGGGQQGGSGQIGAPIAVLQGHTEMVTAVDFSPTHPDILISSSFDGTCRVWNARDSSVPPLVLPWNSERPSTFGLGSGMISLSMGGEADGGAGARSTRGSERRQLATVVRASRTTTTTAAAAVDGGGDGEEVVEAEEEAEVVGTRLLVCSFTRDGKYIVAGSNENCIAVWRWNSPLRSSKINNKIEKVVEVEETGMEIDKEEEEEDEEEAGPSTSAAPPAAVAVVPSEWPRVEKPCRLEGHSNDVWLLQHSNSGDFIASGSVDGTVRVWRRPTGTHKGRGAHAWHLVATLACPIDEAAASTRKKGKPPPPPRVDQIAWTCDDSHILVTMQDCELHVFTFPEGKLIHNLRAHTDSVHVLLTHPIDPAVAITAGYSGDVVVWDVVQGVKWRTLFSKDTRPGSRAWPDELPFVDGFIAADGNSFALSDAAGQLHIYGLGPRCELTLRAPYDQFLSTDYEVLIRDSHGNAASAATQNPAHILTGRELLCDATGASYPLHFQEAYRAHRLLQIPAAEAAWEEEGKVSGYLLAAPTLSAAAWRVYSVNGSDTAAQNAVARASARFEEMEDMLDARERYAGRRARRTGGPPVGAAGAEARNVEIGGVIYIDGDEEAQRREEEEQQQQQQYGEGGQDGHHRREGDDDEDAARRHHLDSDADLDFGYLDVGVLAGGGRGRIHATREREESLHHDGARHSSRLAGRTTLPNGGGGDGGGGEDAHGGGLTERELRERQRADREERHRRRQAAHLAALQQRRRQRTQSQSGGRNNNNRSAAAARGDDDDEDGNFGARLSSEDDEGMFGGGVGGGDGDEFSDEDDEEDDDEDISLVSEEGDEEDEDEYVQGGRRNRSNRRNRRSGALQHRSTRTSERQRASKRRRRGGDDENDDANDEEFEQLLLEEEDEEEAVPPPRQRQRTAASSSRHPRQESAYAWLASADYLPGVYVPQVGDDVVYIRQGHAAVLEDTQDQRPPPWETVPRGRTMRSIESCRIIAMHYIIINDDGSSDATAVQVTLQLSDPTSALYGHSFSVDILPPSSGQAEFVILKSRFEAAVAVAWRVGEQCVAYWQTGVTAGVDTTGGEWWRGTIVKDNINSNNNNNFVVGGDDGVEVVDPLRSSSSDGGGLLWERYEVEWEGPIDAVTGELVRLNSDGGGGGDGGGGSGAVVQTENGNGERLVPLPLSVVNEDSREIAAAAAVAASVHPCLDAKSGEAEMSLHNASFVPVLDAEGGTVIRNSATTAANPPPPLPLNASVEDATDDGAAVEEEEKKEEEDEEAPRLVIPTTDTTADTITTAAAPPPQQQEQQQQQQDPTATTTAIDTSAHSPWELFKWETVRNNPIPPGTPHLDASITQAMTGAVEIAAAEDIWFIFQTAPDWTESFKSAQGRTEYYNRRVALPLGIMEIATRLHLRYYRQKEALQHDLRTISDNAALFNGPSSPVSIDARSLARYLLAVLVRADAIATSGGGGEGGDGATVDVGVEIGPEIDVKEYVAQGVAGWADGGEDQHHHHHHASEENEEEEEEEQQHREEEEEVDWMMPSTAREAPGLWYDSEEYHPDASAAAAAAVAATGVKRLSRQRNGGGVSTENSPGSMQRNGGLVSNRRARQRVNYREMLADDVDDDDDGVDDQEGGGGGRSRFSQRQRSSSQRRSEVTPPPLHHYSTRRAQAQDIAAVEAAAAEGEGRRGGGMTIRLRRQ